MRVLESYIDKITKFDCESVLAALEDKSIDFAFADPPYGINKAEWDCAYPSFEFERQLLRISKGGIAVTPGQENIALCIGRMGAEFQGLHVGRNLNGMTFNKLGFENTIISVIGGGAVRGQSFFEFSISGEKPPHPSPKPIEYMLKLLLRFTKRGDIVLDPYSGSGTTAIACHKLGRHFVCFEKDIQYHAQSQERLELERAQQSLFDPYALDTFESGETVIQQTLYAAGGVPPLAGGTC
ncbi:MAG: site-specific DNA-methyltransferase [Deltaproteobacteria bacterium]|nr:site-specific DNA-methyltransferase [Deltaproteobacteria bacterium]